MLRIDVDQRRRLYAIPADNPFAGHAPARAEIWAYGLRNPWRFSFDRQTGDLYIGDVGQGACEEIDFQPAGAAGGRNYGWDCREGAHATTTPTATCNTNCGSGRPRRSRARVPPLANPECSITGGYVYRGRVASSLTGQYFYGDYCSGKIWRRRLERRHLDRLP